MSFTIISGNNISNNSANYGGAIDCTDGNEMINNNIISNNIATFGGGILCGSEATIELNTIHGNNATWGGAIICANDAAIISNNIYSNSARTVLMDMVNVTLAEYDFEINFECPL